MNEPTSKPNGFISFFSRPIVGIAGSIASIISIALSIYLYEVSREVPELTYFVHPVKAAVVRTGQMSRLSVLLDGQAVTGDITATQIAFWNAGRKPVRANSVLNPLVIKTANGTRILEVRLQKTSREVVGVEVDSSRLALGEVRIKWNILEENDGGVIQVVYAGDENVPLEAHAVLEGQPEVIKLEYAHNLSTPNEEYVRRQGWLQRLSAYIQLCVGIAYLVTLLWFDARRRSRDMQMERKTSWDNGDWSGLVLGVLFLGLGAWNLFFAIPPNPPFGF